MMKVLGLRTSRNNGGKETVFLLTIVAGIVACGVQLAAAEAATDSLDAAPDRDTAKDATEQLASAMDAAGVTMTDADKKEVMDAASRGDAKTLMDTIKDLSAGLDFTANADMFSEGVRQVLRFVVTKTEAEIDDLVSKGRGAYRDLLTSVEGVPTSFTDPAGVAVSLPSGFEVKSVRRLSDTTAQVEVAVKLASEEHGKLVQDYIDNSEDFADWTDKMWNMAKEMKPNRGVKITQRITSATFSPDMADKSSEAFANFRDQYLPEFTAIIKEQVPEVMDVVLVGLSAGSVVAETNVLVNESASDDTTSAISDTANSTTTVNGMTTETVETSTDTYIVPSDTVNSTASETATDATTTVTSDSETTLSPDAAATGTGDASETTEPASATTDSAAEGAATDPATGDAATDAATGDGATDAATGDGATDAATGDGATDAATGDGATDAATGDGATDAATGDGATDAATGDGATDPATGGSDTDATGTETASGTDSTGTGTDSTGTGTDSTGTETGTDSTGTGTGTDTGTGSDSSTSTGTGDSTSTGTGTNTASGSESTGTAVSPGNIQSNGLFLSPGTASTDLDVTTQTDYFTTDIRFVLRYTKTVTAANIATYLDESSTNYGDEVTSVAGWTNEFEIGMGGTFTLTERFSLKLSRKHSDTTVQFECSAKAATAAQVDTVIAKFRTTDPYDALPNKEWSMGRDMIPNRVVPLAIKLPNKAFMTQYLDRTSTEFTTLKNTFAPSLLTQLKAKESKVERLMFISVSKGSTIVETAVLVDSTGDATSTAAINDAAGEITSVGGEDATALPADGNTQTYVTASDTVNSVTAPAATTAAPDATQDPLIDDVIGGLTTKTPEAASGPAHEPHNHFMNVTVPSFIGLLIVISIFLFCTVSSNSCFCKMCSSNVKKDVV